MSVVPMDLYWIWPVERRREQAKCRRETNQVWFGRKFWGLILMRMAGRQAGEVAGDRWAASSFCIESGVGCAGGELHGGASNWLYGVTCYGL